MRAWRVAIFYTVAALALTWPLARALGRNVASDLGDPVFVMWAIAWDCEQLLALLAGDGSRVATFFSAPIFHPAPLTLAYSEHFIPQALQVLPLYAATHDPILSYNLLFLSTFVLSGLGMYLFVRSITGRSDAAFIAGLAFAFSPYRIAQGSHLQVLSAQWMPFALYGIRRYLDAAARRWPYRLLPLAGASAALAVQALSSAYYFAYFTPFAIAYLLWELASRDLWRQWIRWAELTAAALVMAAAIAPFLLPYLLVQRAYGAERPRGEVVRYSADVYSYATTYPEQAAWGDRARAFPRPEGELFPGLTIVALAVMGLCLWRREPVSRAHPREATVARWRQVAGRLSLIAGAIHLAGASAVLLLRRIVIEFWFVGLRMSNATQLLLRAAVLFAVAVALWPSWRAPAARFAREQGFFVAALLAALWLSLGPLPRALGRPLDLVAPYLWLYDHLPGFDGLRVPARFAMIVLLMLSVLAGMGAAVVARAASGRWLLAAVASLCLAEAMTLPFPVNRMSPVDGFNAPEARVYRPARAPAIYKDVSQLPADAVLAELPIGQADFDLRAMFYSLVHRRPILNGYSGIFPPHYAQLAVSLSDVPRHPDAALDALHAAGATHVLVHETAYRGDSGSATTGAFLMAGAHEIARRGGDVVLALGE